MFIVLSLKCQFLFITIQVWIEQARGSHFISVFLVEFENVIDVSEVLNVTCHY